MRVTEYALSMGAATSLVYLIGYIDVIVFLYN